MNSLKQAVMNFIREEEGLTIVEYAIAGGLISVAVATMFGNLGDAVLVVITQLVAAVSGAPAA
jgi:pilus assembly protein Flp/PilA